MVIGKQGAGRGRLDDLSLAPARWGGPRKEPANNWGYTTNLSGHFPGLIR